MLCYSRLPSHLFINEQEEEASSYTHCIYCQSTDGEKKEEIFFMLFFYFN